MLPRSKTKARKDSMQMITHDRHSWYWYEVTYSRNNIFVCMQSWKSWGRKWRKWLSPPYDGQSMYISVPQPGPGLRIAPLATTTRSLAGCHPSSIDTGHPTSTPPPPHDAQSQFGRRGAGRVGCEIIGESIAEPEESADDLHDGDELERRAHLRQLLLSRAHNQRT